MLALDRRLAAVVICLAALAVSCGSADTGAKGQEFDDAVEALEQMGTLRYLIATPSDRECTVVASRDDDSLVPLTSVFKLYVLGALVQAVGSGEIMWDDPVEIRDELDSAGGPTAEEEPGTELSVRELATRMISVSDNTATDHVMDFVGREAVEKIQSAMGHSQPSVNIPMLTTRELTVLLFSGRADLAELYIAADADERRSILDDEVSRLPFPTPTQTEVSVFEFQNLLGWFGTLGDACRALDWLTRDDEAQAILTNQPLSPNPGLWPELGFKGGSGNGIATAAWWMRDGDGQMYVTVVSVVNKTAELDIDRVVELTVALRDDSPAVGAD